MAIKSFRGYRAENAGAFGGRRLLGKNAEHSASLLGNRI